MGSPGSIGVPAALAKCLNLPAALRVEVEAIPNVRESKTVQVEPESPDDWEILELNQSYVELHLLEQVRSRSSGSSQAYAFLGLHLLSCRVLIGRCQL